METHVVGRTLRCVIAAILFLAPQALADGKVFRAASAVVPMVDQEAVICFNGGIEVLAIRTRADMAGVMGEQLAWVVPVPGPGAPDLLTTTDGVFGTARAITQPRLLQHNDFGLGWFLLFVSLFVLLVAASFRYNRGLSPGKRTAVGFAWVIIGFTLMVVILLPTLAKSRYSGGPTVAGDGVEVLKRERVGTLDVTVVRSQQGLDSAKGLAAWLKDAGCDVPVSVEPVLADYAAKGWVFVAARLAPPIGGEPLEPTPLVMRFQATSPVYPMKLTGVGNGPLDLELCVLSSGTAEATGMTVARSSPILAEGESYDNGGVPLLHEGLKDLASRTGSGGPAWITRLTGRLTPPQQSADMTIHIGACARVGEDFYTPAGAVRVGAEWGAGVAAAGLLAYTVMLSTGTPTRRREVKLLAGGFAVACLAGVVIAASVPRYSGEIKVGGRPDRPLISLTRELGTIKQMDLKNLREFIAAKRVEKVEPYASLPPEGDTPNGYTFRTDDKGEVWIELYNRYGVADHGYPLSILRR